MNCKNCGAELTPGAKFCENCGTKVEALNEKEENREHINPDEKNDYGFVREGSERVPPVQPPYAGGVNTNSNAQQPYGYNGQPYGNNNGQPYGNNGQPYGNNNGQPYGNNGQPYGYNGQPYGNTPQQPYGNNNGQPYAVYPGGNTPKKKKSRAGIIVLVVFLVLGVVLGAIIIAAVISNRVIDDAIDDMDQGEVYFPEDEADDYPDYSTYELPSFDDFSWFDEVREYGIWEGAEELTDFYRIDGSWKGMIIYDIDNPQGKEIMNVGISGDAIDTVLNFDWYKIMWNGEAPRDKTDEDDTVLYGGYDEDEDGLFFEYGFTILMRDFYEYEGAQYGICEFTDEDGTESVILLTRP